jgi:two-component sensor histidine kinase
MMMPRTAEPFRLALESFLTILLICAWWRIRRKYNKTIQQKNLLIREIHHRVANQMGLTAAFLHLQASRNTHPGAKASLFESENRLRTLSKLHARLYPQTNQNHIILFTYLSDLAKDLVGTLRPDLDFSPVFACKSPTTSSTTAVTCGLLVHELITNCLKHAFPDQQRGAISLSLNCPPSNRLRISIQDNGIGLPADFSMHAPTTSGIAIITALTQDLAGTFTVTPLNPGVAFIVELPLSNLERAS